MHSQSREGTAIALSLGGLRIPIDKDSAFAVRYGQFEGELAFSAQGAFRLSSDPDVAVDVGAAYGVNHRQTGITAGFTWSW